MCKAISNYRVIKLIKGNLSWPSEEIGNRGGARGLSIECAM